MISKIISKFFIFILIHSIVFVVFLNCQNLDTNSMEIKEINNPCFLLKYKELIKERRNLNYKQVLVGNDSCVLSFIDTLAINISSTNDNSLEYLQILDSVSYNSDGYVGEYLVEVCRTLYLNNFDIFADYLYKNQQSKLIENTIFGFGFIANNNKDLKRLKTKLLKNTTQIRNKSKHKFFRNLINKIERMK